MGTLPNSQCHYIITTIYTGQTEESQVRWGETDAYLMFDNGCKRSSTGSSCIPSIEILLEVCVLPSNIQKNYLFWTGTS